MHLCKDTQGEECNDNPLDIFSLFAFDVTIFKKATEMLRSRRGQEREETILEAQVKIQ